VTEDEHRRAAALALLRRMAEPLVDVHDLGRLSDQAWAAAVLAELAAHQAVTAAARAALSAGVLDRRTEPWRNLRDAVTAADATSHDAAGCPVSPDDPQTGQSTEEGAVSG
jgi:hypothetical protein